MLEIKLTIKSRAALDALLHGLEMYVEMETERQRDEEQKPTGYEKLVLVEGAKLLKEIR